MPRAERKIHYIYKTTCLVTGRYYIGMHSTNNLEDGYLGSGLRLRKSIRKYGKDKHTKEILEYYDNRELLAERERSIVTLELVHDSMCMNLKEGGEGGYGFAHITAEQRALAYENSATSLRNHLKTDSEFRELFGRKSSEMMLSLYSSGQRTRKYFYDWTGKKHTPEAIKKMKISAVGKHSGNKNSQYGTCWITKDGINKRISKCDIDTFLADGWSSGRIMAYKKLKN